MVRFSFRFSKLSKIASKLLQRAVFAEGITNGAISIVEVYKYICRRFDIYQLNRNWKTECVSLFFGECSCPILKFPDSGPISPKSGAGNESWCQVIVNEAMFNNCCWFNSRPEFVIWKNSQDIISSPSNLYLRIFHCYQVKKKGQYIWTLIVQSLVFVGYWESCVSFIIFYFHRYFKGFWEPAPSNFHHCCSILNNLLCFRWKREDNMIPSIQTTGVNGAEQSNRDNRHIKQHKHTTTLQLPTLPDSHFPIFIWLKICHAKDSIKLRGRTRTF